MKRPLLRRGLKDMTETDIRYLQKLLGMPLSGQFDQSTEDAVIKFQKKSKLQADGIVGPYTWAALTT